ncbi:MAG: hypothetical protein K6G58_06505 [Lachnospiraceae bacterium]|nr:hypothetical protein [Lachnospiraceae bacterium]
MAGTVRLLPAECALDLGDGSERGEYVCQNYILNMLGRPHRAVNIMYTYYPLDEQWPMRISEACHDMKVGFAWDYPYDNYYPFVEGGVQFEQMRDIRRHGQEVMLTMTIDCAVSDSQLSDIARSLRPFGRMFLRINHECNGSWFTHNRRYSYEEVAAFFVRFAGIIKEIAPNVRCVFCAGLAGEEKDPDGQHKVELEDVFAEAYRAADVWSADKYTALHFGWPYNIAEPGNETYTADDPEELFVRYERTYERLSSLFGEHPFIQAEFSADGDVTSAMMQPLTVRRYYDAVSRSCASWLSGISMYQFRDRGRLGLEMEDPNDPSVGIRQPLMDEYMDIAGEPYFLPRIERTGSTSFPAELRWGGSEDAYGIEIDAKLEGMPCFLEVTLQADLSLMMEFNGRWFYKSPGVETIDLMPAFYGRPFSGARTIPLHIFATPPDGENHENGREDWDVNQYYTMTEEPSFRIRYESPYYSRKEVEAEMSRILGRKTDGN